MREHPSVDTSALPLPHGLPPGLRPYRQSPVFDQDTIPEALKRNHRVKAGVWAVIHVLEGALRYRIESPESEQVLTPANPGLVRPQEEHAVAADGPVRFLVEFHAPPETADAGDPHA